MFHITAQVGIATFVEHRVARCAGGGNLLLFSRRGGGERWLLQVVRDVDVPAVGAPDPPGSRAEDDLGDLFGRASLVT